MFERPTLLERAERQRDKEIADHKQELQKRFHKIFGYTPQLGAPEGPIDTPEFWVDGFLFRINDQDLQVLTKNGTFTGVGSAWRFCDLVDSSIIEQVDHALEPE